jgi:hypothetical protein
VHLALRDENAKVPGFSLSIQSPSLIEFDNSRVQLIVLNIAVLEDIEKAFACVQCDRTNMRVLSCFDLL